MGQFEINDDNMYQYFEELIYGSESKLKKRGWKKTRPLEEYGLTNHDVSSLLGSRSLLYNRKDSAKQLCAMETIQTFLHEYIGIDGLEELWINNYGVIENNIFLEHDRYGKSAHIREHAKHQMKNAYLGSVLLLECGYVKDMAQNIYEAEGSVTRYLVQQAWNVAVEESQVLQKLEEWSYKIFMLSSLLHDIGYPLEHFLRSAKELADYPPYLKILSPTVKTDFSEIKAHLLGSQLFKLIDNRLIKEKYEANNHGVLSAVSFLMHFYYGGRVHSLSREERCILEMTAIAIYRHTDRFKDGFRMVYKKDPISYMVRLCDDLQEWDRFRIQISNKHNYLQCGKCGRILLESGGEYTCGSCGCQYTKVTQLNNQKVNYVCLCDELVIEKGKKVKLQMKFNLMKQFEVLLDDYTAVVKTAGDMEKVMELMEDQSFSMKLELKYFVSNNPYAIIEQMIKEAGKNEADIQAWIDGQSVPERKQNLDRFFQNYKAGRKKNPFGGELERNKLKYEDKVREFVKEYYGEVYSLYQMLNTEGANIEK